VKEALPAEVDQLWGYKLRKRLVCKVCPKPVPIYVEESRQDVGADSSFFVCKWPEQECLLQQKRSFADLWNVQMESAPEQLQCEKCGRLSLHDVSMLLEVSGGMRYFMLQLPLFYWDTQQGTQQLNQTSYRGLTKNGHLFPGSVVSVFVSVQCFSMQNTETHVEKLAWLDRYAGAWCHARTHRRATERSEVSIC